jgi:(S)-2-hydroxyglutarate dehydrogenase
MHSRNYDIIVIGAGIVGLATAMELVRRFPGVKLLVLEKERAVAAHQSGHNSGVVHSGLYYRPGSLKAKLCVQGAKLMSEFCIEHQIPYSMCGKLVLATDESEVPQLEELFRRGAANGVPRLRKIGWEEIREIEPHARGIRGIHVPTCAITDYRLVTQKYSELVQLLGGEVKIGTAVVGMSCHDRTVVETTVGDFEAKYVVNCAGLQGDIVTRMQGLRPDFQIVPFRGEYYQIVPAKESLVRGLIYPVPDPRFPFLGVHFTRRVQGGVEAGPNAVLALEREGYKRSSFKLKDAIEIALFPGTWKLARKYWHTGTDEYYRSLWKPAFVKALQKLVPDLRSQDLREGGSGVRAMVLRRDGTLADDFEFLQSERAIHVCNVPSPAATASLLIGKVIADEVQFATNMKPVDETTRRPILSGC